LQRRFICRKKCFAIHITNEPFVVRGNEYL